MSAVDMPARLGEGIHQNLIWRLHWARPLTNYTRIKSYVCQCYSTESIINVGVRWSVWISLTLLRIYLFTNFISYKSSSSPRNQTNKRKTRFQTERSVECEKRFRLQLAFIQRSMEYSSAATHLWIETNKQAWEFLWSGWNNGAKREISLVSDKATRFVCQKNKSSQCPPRGVLFLALTAFCPSPSRSGSSNSGTSARAAPARRHAFCRLLRTAVLCILASTPCLFV